jgi:membrane-anchored protein YejM (alkaline phosphatase superfamily)
MITMSKAHAMTNVNWSLWFAVFSPIIGVVLGALGVFIVER